MQPLPTPKQARHDLTRRLLLAAPATLLPLPALAAEPILAGVSGPLTGPNAQYGAQWKRGFDHALDEINGAGGVNGRPVAYVFEDSQADPRQSVTIAQKFVSDPRIIMELGDFASPASMAASPIYQRAKLTQFGFTNSHPDFTKGGDYMWSNSPSQADEQPLLAAFAVRQLGVQRPGVLYLNTDWGRASKDVFVKAATEIGAKVVGTEGYLPTDQDFRSALVRLRDAKPDGLILLAALRGCSARRAADPRPWPEAGDCCSKLDLLAGVPGACRSGGERRVLHGGILSYRTTTGGATFCRRLSREIPAGPRHV